MTNENTEIRFTSLNYSFDAFGIDAEFEDLDKNALDIFEKQLITSGRYISSGNLQKDFAEMLGISVGVVKEYIEKLKDKGLLLRIGNNRTGYWQVFSN
jgi:biotin operon repressor